MNDLDFIKDPVLRKTLEDSIEYIYALYEETKQDGQKPLYREETYRVIVLYVVSAIEAVLFYFYKTRGEKITKVSYRCIQTLSTSYQNKEKPGLPVIIAVQEGEERKDYELGLYELVKFFLTLKLIQEKTAKEILAMNRMRNTFHFNKPRPQICDKEQVENALRLLVHTLQNAPKSLEIKK